LRRVIASSAGSAKLLILLGPFCCRETGQDVCKQDRTCVFDRAAVLTHKVFHRRSGEMQNLPRIMNLPPEPDFSLKFAGGLPHMLSGDA
jgi:hypothetical protein